MRTFTPVKLFFHVQDKFVASFIRHDPACPPGPARLYEHLFAACKDRDRCRISQETLSMWEKKTPRSLQSYLALLTKLEYIHIEKNPTGCNVYYLLLSDRLLDLLFKLGTPLHGFSPCRPDAVRSDSDEPAREKISPDLRVNKKEEITPLSPLPKPTAIPSPRSSCRIGLPSSAPAAPQRVQGRGDFFSLSQTRLHRPAHEFEQLWAAWPQTASWAMPRNRQHALREFQRLSRAGVLPPIEKLLGIVEQYKTTDSRWLNGYPSELSNWLRTRQFEKAPLVREKKPFFKAFFSKSESAELAMTPEERGLAEAYRSQIEVLHKRYEKRSTAPSPLSSPGSDALIALWPEPERQRVPVTGFLQYLAGIGKQLDVARLLPEARDYLASTRSPMSLVGWLRGQQGVSSYAEM
ncbi:MAG: hypothetical protein E7I62_15505 [Bilophila wadsworthia]|uniref:hypothetical protein n=1 Tax=Bilophila wadsworthia TaxID=35833 RepID=UPI00290F7213|nr:hypothetical protein [Bilophila wadsworthia]MDU4376999.1 hypothetical protein [Bilophila wadsworthia]